ncbi:MFS-type transporter SLC18B1 [Armadillidium vulgare]|nr:MFS-type transporter SLC18B1 [Armadillidium vulgare]
MMANDREGSLTEKSEKYASDSESKDLSYTEINAKTANSDDENKKNSQAYSESKLDLSQSFKTEKSDEDSPDCSSVYRSTTELSKSTEENDRFCWCCCARVQSNYKNCHQLFSEFSSRQWRVITMLCLGTLTSSLSVCLFPPFFPKLAESKDQTATMYGMVIGTNCLTAFIVTPIIGKNMETIGVNFAFLEYFNPGFHFILMSILIRILHATGNACVITSTIAFIASEFPTSVPFLFSLTRAAMNLAQMFGPALGGALHNAGGFKMPFFVLGSLQVFVSFVCAYFLPSFRGRKKDLNNETEKKGTFAVFKIPGVWISFITFIFSTMSNGFLSITLEPRVLRQFNISPFYVGLLFGLKDGANCFASPVWGWLCDKLGKTKVLIIIGSFMAALSFILLGPFPGLPVQHTIWVIIIALILNGFGVGGQQVAGVVSAMKDTVDAGFPDEPDTHAFVASLWSSLSGGGRFISRAGSGFLVDTIGYRPTSAIVTSFHIFILVVSLTYVCLVELKQDKKDHPVKRRSMQIHVDTNSPTEPLGSKSASVAIPIMREDLEDSFMIGSSTSHLSKRV